MIFMKKNKFKQAEKEAEYLFHTNLINEIKFGKRLVKKFKGADDYIG